MADPKGPPVSPDQLGGGLKGTVSGVTRIGPRAFAIFAGIAGVILLLIFYGVSKKSGGPTPGNGGPVAMPSMLNAAPTPLGPIFSSDVPVVPTTEATVTPFPVATTSVDLPTAAPAEPPPQAPPVQVAPVESADDKARDEARLAAEAKAEADRLAKLKADQEALDAARRSKILTGEISQAGGVNVQSSSGVQQLSYAPTDPQNGTSALNSGGTGGAGAANDNVYTGNGGGSSVGGAGIGGGGGGGAGQAGAPTQNQVNALLGRPSGGFTAAPSGNAPADTSQSFLLGPTNQYSHIQNANVNLPPGGNPIDFLQAQRFAPASPFEITAGSVFPSDLITGIDSELAGLITAQIREDVYDTKTGKYLLIPRGARLIGLYKSVTGYGSSRVLVAWQRLIFPDTTSIDLQNMSGSDVEGSAGFGGDVDNHYGKIFGAAILTSVLAAGAAVAAPAQTVSTTGIGVESPTTLAASEVSQNILNIGTSITNKALSIPPTIYVRRGYPFLVVVDKDIVLPGPYGKGI